MQSSSNVTPESKSSESLNEISETNIEKKPFDAKVAAVILGLSGVGGFISAYYVGVLEKKRSSSLLEKVSQKSRRPGSAEVYAEARILALKALAWGTLYAVGGCSLFFYAFWKFMGFKNLEDFRKRAHHRTKKSSSADERTEFESFTDLYNYLKELKSTKQEAKKV